MQDVLPADTFIVKNKTILGDMDRKLLIMLYQPIIGSTAISLYFTLWSYLDKRETLSEEWSHHHLMTNMRMKLKDIMVARTQLEAIGLLRTYQKQDHINHYIYELFSPNSASEFINNPILSTSLYHNVGDTEYKNIIEYFKVPKFNMKEYREITTSFHELFESSSLSYIEQLEIETKTRNTNVIQVEETIDLDSIFTKIPTDLFYKKTLTKETKELIVKLAFIYHLDEEHMGDLIRNSINEKKAIDKNLLKQNCRKFYQFENNGKLPSIIYRNQPEYLRKPDGDTSKKAKMIYQFETTSPYDFLCSKYNGVRPSKSDLSILEYLLLTMDLKPGVANVLIDYVLKINGNKLTKGFIEAIASQWAKSKVETVEAAMQLAEKEYRTRKNNVKVSTKKQEVKPEWFDQKIARKEASQEKKHEMEKLVKEVIR